MILHAAVVVCDAEGTIYSPGAVRIKRTGSDRGCILAAGPQSKVTPVPGEPVLDLGPLWLIPGLIQAHVHLNQTLFRGLAEGYQLLDWLRKRIWPLEAAHDYASVYASARQSLAEMMLNGCTSALTMESTHHTQAAFDACQEMGIRARVGTALMDRTASGMPEALYRGGFEALVEMVVYDREYGDETDERVRGCVAPRFVLSCTDDLFEKSIEIASEHDMIWHSHVSENSMECEEVRKQTGMNNLEYFGHIGALGHSTSLAHGVWLTEAEIEMAAREGVTILHCPSTNLKLGSGISDTMHLLNKGVTVALGSDGAPCNNRLDIFDEIRLAGKLALLKAGPDKVDPAKIFGFATSGGAKALGLDGKIGRVAENHFADLVAINPGSFVGEASDPERIYSHLVFAASGSDVQHVWIDGKQVVKDRALQTVDPAEILDDYKRQRTALLHRVDLP